MIHSIESIANDLIGRIRSHGSAIVAFSGGVDSGVVAAAAFRALNSSAIAITGVGPAVPEHDLQAARDVASSIGIRHVELPTEEILDTNYIRNDARRCYYCKSSLYRSIRAWANANHFNAVLSGTNLDDLGDYRPGLEAAQQFDVSAPLAELRIDKNGVRQLAEHFQLSIADKPASPCLASRIAYGQAVTLERLEMIEAAENFLKQLGFQDVRVRLHENNLIRIELSQEDIHRVCDAGNRIKIHEHMRSLGCAFVTLDLGGRQSGSLNRVLPILH